MNKIFNWTFGSFFRTLGRILVYIVIGYILFNLLNISDIKLPKFNFSSLLYLDVNADVINIGNETNDSYVYLTNNSYLFSNYYFLGDININNSNTTRYKIHTLNSIAEEYTFFIIDMCANNIVSANRTSNLGQSCTNSCFSNQVQVEKTNFTCISNGNNGYIYRTTIPISKWDIGVDTDEKMVSDQITYTTLSLGNVPITIYGMYLSNELNNDNFIVDYTNAINAITNQSITNSNNIINNQNSNTNSIINNQNSNTQDIIDNQNSNNQAQIDSQKVCTTYDKNNIEIDNKFISNSNGATANSPVWGISNYIKITDKADITYLIGTNTNNVYLCYYNTNKTLISCQNESTIDINSKLLIPNITEYIRFSVNKNYNAPQLKICINGNQAMQDTLTDSNISQSTNDASNFFSNFTTDTHGLTGIITAPLNAINSLTSATCSPLVLPLPFINENLTLPCMRPIYESYFGNFMILYDIITLGIVSYWVMVRIFSLVKDFKNPEHDEIEVVDL